MTSLWQNTLTGIVRRSLLSIARTPREKVLRRGEQLGRLAYNLPFCRKYRTRGVKNFELVYPNTYTLEEREQKTKAVFEHMGRITLDFLHMSGYSKEQIDSIVEISTGEEHFYNAQKRGKGVVLVTGHIGNWEMMARYAVARDIPLTVIWREPREDSSKDFLKELRESGGYSMIGRGTSAARTILKRLRQGEVVALLPDQNSGDCFVPFLGIPAGAVQSPVKLAFKTGAAIVPVCAIYLPESKKYRVEVYPELDITQTGDEAADVYRVLLSMNEAIGKMIEKTPLQWLWLHDRWKSAFEEENIAQWPEGYDYEELRKRKL